MKITKARLKELIKEEIQSEVLGTYLAARARKQMDDGDGDGEGAMADSQLNRIADLATMIDEMVDDDTNLPEWVESKITKAQDYMSAVMNYMKGEQADAQEDVMEEELTKAQIKKRDKRAKKIMPSTEEQYGKKRGKEIAYAIATDQVTEET